MTETYLGYTEYEWIKFGIVFSILAFLSSIFMWIIESPLVYPTIGLCVLFTITTVVWYFLKKRRDRIISERN